MPQTETKEARRRPTATVEPGEGIHIDFSRHYRKESGEYDFFPMKRKRNFMNMAAEAAEALNVLLEDEDFTFGLVALRFDITLPEMDPEFVSIEEFPRRLHELFDERAAALVRAASTSVNIDTNYDGENDELQFTNDHARVILQWAFACIAAAPIITTFMEIRDVETKDAVPFLMGCFGTLLWRFEPEGMDIMAKIKKLSESRVTRTQYSDKVIWNYLRNLATDPSIFIDNLFRKFIVEGVPKLRQGSNVISFLHTFLKQQIKFKFTQKFALHYQPVRADVMDGEGMTSMEKLETELIRRDEGAAVLGEVNIVAAVRAAQASLEEPPGEEEVLHWAESLRAGGINAWQRGMITKFFLNRIGRVEAVRTRTLNEYARMLLVTRQWMRENDFPALADYMGAKVVEGTDGRRLASRKRFVKEFMDSAEYQSLLGVSYGLTSQALIDSGVVIEMISAVHMNSFERLPELGEEPPAAPERVDHRIEAVAQEVLRFISHVARPPA